MIKPCTTLTKEILLQSKKEGKSAKQIAKEHNVSIPTVYKYAKIHGLGRFKRPYRHNLLGIKSGRLLVIEETNKRKHGAVIWKCLCDCGNYAFIRSDALITKHTKSCGCISKEGTNYLPKGEASKNAFYTSYEHGARRRNVSFEISKNDFISMAEMNCYYCGESPSRAYKPHKTANGEFICNSIDRLDSNKGYTLDNCVPACYMCNKMKMEFSKIDFLKKIKRIYEYRGMKNEISK